ncbi:DUF6475 domain-containing protein [Orrella marina]|uniref:DUF6475 domain-containing protein n=1 Tax=Orrella marina TaxID=2163011 RepID=A0A2R4XEZ2_9BURK|nr:DUF6475 domain-containing protein [Orrella marina]AWB32360.1 hypothetical protein DBV39_00040 [Orrella marina]
MIDRDRQDFFVLLADVHAFYNRDLSEFSGEIWWNALRPFDFPAVREAFSRHCVNPDSGQFSPKPADIVRMLGGSTQDSALVAWSKVDRAVRLVGTYRSVVFDDALTHRVIHDMGGWLMLARKTESEWPFIAKEFENRYRGYRIRSESPPYPPKLVGESEAQNLLNGQPVEEPVLIGNSAKALAVLAGGTDDRLLEFISASAIGQELLPPVQSRIAA